MSAGGKNGKTEKDARRHVRRSHAARHRTEPSGSPEDVAAQLAPLEEQTAARESGAGAKGGGAIVVDADALKLPEGLVASKEKKRLILGVEPVVFFIIAFAVAFIIFIAWLISGMPTPSVG